MPLCHSHNIDFSPSTAYKQLNRLQLCIPIPHFVPIIGDTLRSFWLYIPYVVKQAIKNFIRFSLPFSWLIYGNLADDTRQNLLQVKQHWSVFLLTMTDLLHPLACSNAHYCYNCLQKSAKGEWSQTRNYRRFLYNLNFSLALNLNFFHFFPKQRWNIYSLKPSSTTLFYTKGVGYDLSSVHGAVLKPPASKGSL